MNWDEERTGRLKALWAEGKSAAQIAKAMGTTRNAVMGKMFRLGLSDKDRQGAHAEATARRRRKKHQAAIAAERAAWEKARAARRAQ